MELRPEIVKTIKRLSLQTKNEVLKNKLREWLQAKDFTLDDLLYNCVEGNISLSGTILNKLGTLYSLGQEGFPEDTEAAFALFEIAAELGHPTANGNCSQYYFDGRAPEGKKIELAYHYCKKAIELGADRHMLMSEILYDQRLYAETVACLHSILDKGQQDRKRKAEARDLERLCLLKQLNRAFHRLNTFEDPVMSPNGATPTPVRARPLSIETTQAAPSPARSISTAAFFASPRALRSPRTALFASATSPKRPKTTSQSPLRSAIESASNALQRMQLSNGSNGVTTGSTAAQLASTETAAVSKRGPEVALEELPGWVRISEDLDGFDRNSCTELTAQAEMLELEAHALRTAWETAQEHVTQARRNNLSEDIIRLLNDTKVAEFKALYEKVLANKDLHIACWDAYTDTQEHVLRRQLLVEQAFFNPRTTVNQATMQLAETLLKRRTTSDIVVAATTEPLVLNILPTHREHDTLIPSSRSLLTAEKALLDIALATYEPRTYQTALSNTSDGEAAEEGKEASSRTVLLYTGWTAEPMSRPHRGDSTSAGEGPRSGSPLRLSSPLGRVNSMDSPVKRANGHSTTLTTDGISLRPEPAPALTPLEALVIDDATLRYKLSTTVPLIPNDRNVHQSGYYAEDMPSSDEVLQLLNKVTMVAEDTVYAENEKILAQMVLRFTHDGKPFSLEELQLLNPELIYDDKVQLDRAVFHYFVRRLVKWLLPPCEENEGLLVPMASIQARTLQLIEAGIISWKEAFDRDGLFGVFYSNERPNAVHPPAQHASTGAGGALGTHHQHHHQHHRHSKHPNHNHLAATLQNQGAAAAGVLSLHHTTSSHHVAPLQALRNKAKHINALYQKYVVELQQRNFLPVIQYWKQHTTGATIPTYRLLYAELAQCYGGEIDDGTTDIVALCEEVALRDDAMHDLLRKLQS